jgi:hypothetical protein
MIIRRGGRLEVERQAGGDDPVDVVLGPGGRAELGPDDRGEAFVAQVARVGYLPAILGLEVVGEDDKVVAGVAVGGGDILGLHAAVGPVRVAVKVATKEAAFSVLQYTLCHDITPWRASFSGALIYF